MRKVYCSFTKVGRTAEIVFSASRSIPNLITYRVVINIDVDENFDTEAYFAMMIPNIQKLMGCDDSIEFVVE